MTGQNGKKPRLVYEYKNEEFEIPQRFVYQIHQSKGGGFDISESFFTWAFNKHEISITDIQILYSNEDRSPKKDKNSVAASSTFFVAVVKGRDKRNVEKVGDGESGNESITNFQRGYPAGLAIKRAKVNMGKEFFNLVDLKMAIDCRDVLIPNGQDKGKTLEELARTPQGQNTIRWYASPEFNPNDEEVFKYKAQQFCEKYLGGSPTAPQKPANAPYREPIQIPQENQNQQQVQSSGVQSDPNSQTQIMPSPTSSGSINSQPMQSNVQTSGGQGQYASPPTGQATPPTQEQYNVIGAYSQKFQLSNEVILQHAQSMFGPQFNWQIATSQQTDQFISALQGNFGPLQ